MNNRIIKFVVVLALVATVVGAGYPHAFAQPRAEEVFPISGSQSKQGDGDIQP